MTKPLSATQLKRFEEQLERKRASRLLQEYGYGYDKKGYEKLYEEIVGKSERTLKTKKADLQIALAKKKLCKTSIARITDILAALEEIKEPIDIAFLTSPAAKAFIKAIEEKREVMKIFEDKVYQHNTQVRKDAEEILNEAIFRNAEWAIEALKNF